MMPAGRPTDYTYKYQKAIAQKAEKMKTLKEKGYELKLIRPFTYIAIKRKEESV